MDPWARAKGKARADAEGARDEREGRAGRTYRAPKPHAAATNEKDPSLVTKVSTALYNEQGSAERKKIRKMLGQELEELEKDSSAQRRQLRKHAYSNSSETHVSGDVATSNSTGRVRRCVVLG